MKSKDLLSFLGDIESLLYRITDSKELSVVDQDLSFDAIYAISNLESIRSQIPNDEDISTVCFVLEDELGKILDMSIDEISAHKDGKLKDYANPTISEDLSSYEMHSIPDGKENNINEVKLIKSKDHISSPIVIDKDKYQINVSSKFFFGAFAKIMKENSEICPNCDSVLFDQFCYFLANNYRSSRSIVRMIEIFVSTCAYESGKPPIKVKGNTFTLDALNVSDEENEKTKDAVLSRYKHTRDLSGVIKESLMIKDGSDSVLATIFNFS